jgi:hypothetical protein
LLINSGLSMSSNFIIFAVPTFIAGWITLLQETKKEN